MKFDDILNKIEEYAPLKLSTELCKISNMYDNSGIIFRPEDDNDIKNILFTLDLTSESVRYAEENGCNLIITHHPAIYNPIKRIDSSVMPLRRCVTLGIGIISLHLNLDCAEFGIDNYFAEGLGGKVIDISEKISECTGYGRLSEVDTISADELCNKYKENFNTQKVWLYGEPSTQITKIASFCGAGLNYDAIDYAIKNGAQLVASADISHHVLLSAIERGLCVLACTHYATENYGMKKIANHYNKILKNEKIYFFSDERFL